MKNTIKGVVLGIVLTLVVEMGIFVYQTCNMSVQTTYTYNPSNIISMMPEATEVVTNK